MKIELNKDINIVNDIRNKLKETNGYCPCAIVHNDDTKCMCKEFIERNTPGYCHCGLYYKS